MITDEMARILTRDLQTLSDVETEIADAEERLTALKAKRERLKEEESRRGLPEGYRWGKPSPGAVNLEVIREPEVSPSGYPLPRDNTVAFACNGKVFGLDADGIPFSAMEALIARFREQEHGSYAEDMKACVETEKGSEP